MLYVKKKKVHKWTKAKQNPLCILKEIYVKKIAGFIWSFRNFYY